MAVTIKSKREIELMRESCRLLAEVHAKMGEAIKPGISTLEIDVLGERLIRSCGCVPNFLHYNGYPASICVSVNDEVVLLAFLFRQVRIMVLFMSYHICKSLKMCVLSFCNIPISML